MKNFNVFLLLTLGLLLFNACEKEEDDIVPQAPTTNNNNNNNGGGTDTTTTNSNQPSQELRNMSSNSIVMTDVGTNAKTTFDFDFYTVNSTNSGKSASIFVHKNQNPFTGGDQFLLVFTEGQNNPILPGSDKTFAYRTPPIATYPDSSEWQFKLCPDGGISDQNYDCYTQEQGSAPFYRILSETKMFYERNGDTHTFMFENHMQDDKTFMGKIVVTNTEMGKANWDGSQEKGSL